MCPAGSTNLGDHFLIPLTIIVSLKGFRGYQAKLGETLPSSRSE